MARTKTVNPVSLETRVTKARHPPPPFAGDYATRPTPVFEAENE
jgi:hypothetical protein